MNTGEEEKKTHMSCQILRKDFGIEYGGKIENPLSGPNFINSSLLCDI